MSASRCADCERRPFTGWWGDDPEDTYEHVSGLASGQTLCEPEGGWHSNPNDPYWYGMIDVSVGPWYCGDHHSTHYFGTLSPDGKVIRAKEAGHPS